MGASVAGFVERPGQRRLAGEVARTLGEGGVLVAEAGTGTGKTFAYAVPALLFPGRVVISTGTRTLQDQLFHRDLPRCRDALGVPSTIALLKGRSNYLCRFRLYRAVDEGLFPDPDTADALQEAAAWAATTRSGDLAEAPGTVARVAGRITTSPDGCLGQLCPSFDGCFFFEARRRAYAADVVVVNHHLLLSDWAVKDSGYGAVLPPADAFILDEAHQLPEAARAFFGRSVSARALRDVARDTRSADRREAGDVPDLPPALGALEEAVDALRRTLGGTKGSAERRAAWTAAGGAAEVALRASADALAWVEAVLEPMAVRGAELEGCHRRVTALVRDLDAFAEPPAADTLHWFETRGAGFTLYATPLEVGEGLSRRMSREAPAWVLTSATLTVDGSFAPFLQRFGLEAPRTLAIESPFDYPEQALLYVPQGMPPPNTPGYDAAVLEAAVPVLEAAPGGAFFLFTSHRALKAAAEALARRLDRPLLVQGQAGQKQLLDRFVEAGDAVLLGAASFWEGVDVRGAALSTVIIDRLPFASPGDPVTAARMEAAERAGRSSFADVSLPEAVLALKQGAGRLIRDEWDRGVLMIADPRLLSRGYGQAFRRSLPPMPLIRTIEEVAGFWRDGPSFCE